MKLQEYLNQIVNKDQIKEINLAKINQERGENAELLEGGELDLREFKNLIEVRIDSQYLVTPLTKIRNGLTDFWWNEIKEESEEDKKLWTELGISGDLEKKKVVKEIRRLGELKQIQVHFGQESAETELDENSKGDIFLLIDKRDKLGNFCPELVFWNFTRELLTIGGETPKTPTFWTTFDKELEWVKQNVSSEYFQELENLTVPSLFPTDKLDISHILAVDCWEKKDKDDYAVSSLTVNSQIVDKAWQTIKEKVLELGIRATIDYNQPDYTITINYSADNPNGKELEKLMTQTPLQLENEYLKEKQEQLPSSENFEKLKKQVEVLVKYLKENLDEEDYQKIKAEVDKIN